MQVGEGFGRSLNAGKRRKILIALLGVAIIIGAILSRFWFVARSDNQQSNANRPKLLRAGSDAGYVDGATCTGCHREIWETYRHTGMGRSLARPGPEVMVEDFTNNNTFHHVASDRHYKMYQKDGRYYQRRHQLGFDGRETNVVESEIHFVLGSGNHARTYLHRTPEGRIFELPVAWYSEKGGYWAMNPGYDFPNHYDFSREITHECVFCHAAYPEIVAGADRFGSEPRFPGRAPERIDCQRCHGPGLRHLHAARDGNKQAIRETIVNPARLPHERQLELCMQCHLETTSARLPHSIVRFDRGAYSYRPGQPLSDYVLHFDQAAGTGWNDKFQIAHQAYRLRKSACFQKSGQLTCTTCHNPHTAPKGQAAIDGYTTACRGCHALQIERQIALKKHTAARNCLECHMPKRRTDDVVHVVMTDHDIQRRKPARDLLAPIKERHDSDEIVYQGPVVLYYPSKLASTPETELYLAVAQVKQLTNLNEGIPRLAAALGRYRPGNGEFYFELAEAYGHLGLHQDAVRLYEESIGRKPDFWQAWLGLGRTLSKSGQHDRGAEALEKALKLKPDAPAILNDLALIYGRQGRPADAAAAFRKVIGIDAAYSEAYNNLGGALIETGDRAGAEAAFSEAIRIQPDYSGAHRNLANLLAARGEALRSGYHFRKAIYHNPNYAAAHFDYGIALAGLERYDQAGVQFEAAVRIDPKLAEAQTSLGDMMALQGMTARAVQHYERALAINPEMGPAHLGLGSALASQRKRSDAVIHLEKAARSADPAIRDAAQEALQALRR